jgi:transcription initiation factor TFIID TATA-box-binding protein
MTEYVVQNVVASISLNQEISLKKLKKLPNAKYNPEQFPGLVLKYPDMQITFLVFSSGKLVCTGGKSRAEIEKALERLKKDLAKKGIKINKKWEIEIQNIVASSDLNRTIDLNRMAYELENTQYNPEQFPGLVYTFEREEDSHPITFLIFGTGKIVCTGAKKESEVGEAITALIKTLNEHNL